MNLNQFTIKSEEAVQRAQEIGATNEHQSIEPSHILKGVMEVDENIIPFLFSKLNVNVDRISSALEKQIASYPKVSGAQQYLSQESNKLLTKAVSTAKDMKDEYVSLEHLFLTLLSVKDPASQMLKDAG